MKKSIFLAVAAVAMTACSNDVDLGMKDANKQTADNAIGFEVRNSNMSRAQNLQDTKHYNFGVFAYKNVATNPAIMENYLVGYFGTNVGYKTTSSDQTTSDQTTIDQSLWAYEKLGYLDYTYEGSDGHYIKGNIEYMSNIDHQYLRYWDFSTRYTHFYAYAPYINKEYNTLSTGVTFDYSTKVMKFPAGSIKDGYNDASLYEYLYATATADRDATGGSQYGEKVSLTFKHLNSMIKIAFWEDIKGYKVNMESLTNDVDISAAPASQSGSAPNYRYTYGTFMKEAKADIDFTSTPSVTLTSTKNYNKSASDKFEKYLCFAKPTATSLAETKESINDDDYSSDVYFGIPNASNCGLTFHVSFTLTAKQTNETIKVQNATVHVPVDACKWEAGKRYTYIFRITKATTGTTGNPGVIDPSSPDIQEDALYPIIFDNITVDDWEPAADSEHDIN